MALKRAGCDVGRVALKKKPVNYWSRCSNWRPFAFTHARSRAVHWSTASSTTHCEMLAHVSTRRFFKSIVSRTGVLYRRCCIGRVLFIALLTPYLAASAELLQKKLCCNCCVVGLNVFQFCYGLEACPLRKADLNMLDFVVNRFFMKLFRTNNSGMVKECQSYFSFQLPTEMLKQKTERFDMKFKCLAVI